MIVRFLAVFLLFAFCAHAQPNQGALSALEVVRNIDTLLHQSKLEATQAGRLTAFEDQINIAKSFVHANQTTKAKTAYLTALNIAWNRSSQAVIIDKINALIDRYDPALNPNGRPQGLDENYAKSNTITPSATDPTPIDKYAAGAKIDAMLTFLYTDIISTKADQLMLQGKLADCRYLVSLELFDQAQSAYHSTIIKLLDPRWTSQLLGEIELVMRTTLPELTPTEKNPGSIQSIDACIAEVDILLKPIAQRYGQNQSFQAARKAILSHIRENQKEAALATFESELMPFVPKEWFTSNAPRFEAIMQRTPALSDAPPPTMSISTRGPYDMPHTIVYYSEEIEGRVTETLRILEDKQWNIYRKITHPWGGQFYFLNDESTKDTEWIRVFKMYENQKELIRK